MDATVLTVEVPPDPRETRLLRLRKSLADVAR
jgi:hypothetical protein